VGVVGCIRARLLGATKQSRDINYAYVTITKSRVVCIWIFATGYIQKILGCMHKEQDNLLLSKHNLSVITYHHSKIAQRAT
jgi:hypothetical protein